MKQHLVCCGILRREVALLSERRLLTVSNVHFLPAGLHVDLDKLKAALEAALSSERDSAELSLLYGRQCHPEIAGIAEQFGATMAAPGGCSDCIAVLLGKEALAELNAEAKSFFLTPGWLENWEQIFKEGLGWDSVDARQNFGFYDRIVLLDTGVGTLDDETILAFFDYTGVPIEIRPITLDRLAMTLNSDCKQND